ncbi:hypothetical protein TNCV_1608141 [Trichonephila clavipes]|nr:hypothetical protein TNCV_1608141 [Trichonephila clavipes]
MRSPSSALVAPLNMLIYPQILTRWALLCIKRTHTGVIKIELSLCFSFECDITNNKCILFDLAY